MAETADTWSWWPWRRHAEQKAAVNGEITKLQKAAEDIRADHGLDQLVIDIERARARGERAMKRAPDDQEEKPRRASQA